VAGRARRAPPPLGGHFHRHPVHPRDAGLPGGKHPGELGGLAMPVNDAPGRPVEFALERSRAIG